VSAGVSFKAVGTLLVAVCALPVVDYFWPLPIRNCSMREVIDTPERAREFAFAYWRTHERRVLFDSKRYRSAKAILAGLVEDGRIEIQQRLSLLNLGYVWHVGGDIYKFNPEYYGFGLLFNRCGVVLDHDKVG
jgi:hypothetical protein